MPSERARTTEGVIAEARERWGPDWKDRFSLSKMGRSKRWHIEGDYAAIGRGAPERLCGVNYGAMSVVYPNSPWAPDEDACLACISAALVPKGGGK